MDMLKKYLESDIDLSPLGFCRCGDAPAYFCDPIGARVIGDVGVDGIHFCVVDGAVSGCGEKYVFIVRPTAGAGEYVRAVARSFGDFLALLLACRDTGNMEFACAVTRERFESDVRETAVTPEAEAAMRAIREKFGVGPIADAYAYMNEVADEFDTSALRFGEEYEELMNTAPPVFHVGYREGFLAFEGEGDGGGELPPSLAIEPREFDWSGESWRLLAVYKCGRGLVVDIARRVEQEKMCDFAWRWGLLEDEEGSGLTEEQREQAAAENPFGFSISARLRVGDGESVRAENVMAAASAKFLRETSDDLVAEHYALDEGDAWQVFRCSFPCGDIDAGELSLTLSANPRQVRAAEFRAEAGLRVKFSHPKSGRGYTLTVTELTDETMPEHDAGLYEIPPCVTRMKYKIEPDIDADGGVDKIIVTDAETGDEPRVRDVHEAGNDFAAAAAIGIIGGSDGPTVIFATPRASREKFEPGEKAVFSHPRYEHRRVLWEIDFSVRDREDVTVTAAVEKG